MINVDDIMAVDSRHDADQYRQLMCIITDSYYESPLLLATIRLGQIATRVLAMSPLSGANETL
jgi:hypothetical protein